MDVMMAELQGLQVGAQYQAEDHDVLITMTLSGSIPLSLKRWRSGASIHCLQLNATCEAFCLFGTGAKLAVFFAQAG
jgi:hypothetical protein